MTAKQVQRTKTLRSMADALLSIDFASNYDCADSMAESVVSELETDHELSPDDCDEISAYVSDWFFDHEDETQDEDEGEDE